MTADRSSRRTRTLLGFAAGLLSLAAVPVLGFVAVDALRTSTEGQNAIADVMPLVRLPPTPGVLFATIDDLGEVTSMTVLALAPPAGDQPARGGTAISVPVTAEAFSSAGEAINVADAYVLGGAEELHAATEGLLGVTLDGTIVADESTTARLLGRAAPIAVEFPTDVLDVNALGQTLTLFPAGPAELGADDIAAVLLARTADDDVTALYERSADVWRAIAERVGDGLSVDGTPVTTVATSAPATSAVDAAGVTAAPPAPPSSPDPVADPEGFVDRFLTGPVGSYRLNFDPVTEAGVNRVRVNLAEVNLVMATVLPGAVSPSFASITFYVRSPLGDPRLTLDAVGMLLFAGANVVLVTEEPGTEIPAKSVLQVVDAADLLDARRFVVPFGDHEERAADARIEGVDAILTLGENYRTLLEDALDPTSTVGATDDTDTGSGG